jgi:hypothetical protein
MKTLNRILGRVLMTAMLSGLVAVSYTHQTLPTKA